MIMIPDIPVPLNLNTGGVDIFSNSGVSDTYAFEGDLIIGVDPGFSGAIAVYSPSQKSIIAVTDMPTTSKSAQSKPQIVLSELQEFIAPYALYSRLAIIEDVGAMPGQGVVSMFRFGFATGIMHGMLGSFGIPITTVKPSIWKPSLGLQREKHHAIEKAKQLFPKSANQFTRTKDGRAEAALLAYFGTRIPT
jgi:crossover junction endodeoxyribonuclease RuvC